MGLKKLTNGFSLSMFLRCCHIFFSGSALFVCCACSEPAPPSAVPAPSLDWVLGDPEVVPLHMPEDLFLNRLPTAPGNETCHTQGLEIVDDFIYISCCLYNASQKLTRTFESHSLVLKARWSAVTAGKNVEWTIHDFTEPAPASEQERIEKTIFQNLPPALHFALEWLLPLEGAVHVLGHPSGLTYDPAYGGLWLANAVYSRDSYTKLLLLDPETLAVRQQPAPWGLNKHFGYIGVSPGGILWSANWGENEQLYVMDPRMQRVEKRVSPLLPRIAYQDCTHFDQDLILCVGDHRAPNTVAPYQRGVMHLLRVQGNSIDNFELTPVSRLLWELTPTQFSEAWGERSFLSVEYWGDVELNPENRYGDYVTNSILTNEGVAISPDRQYVYFLPDDVPHGKLIRFRIKPYPKGAALAPTR